MAKVFFKIVLKDICEFSLVLKFLIWNFGWFCKEGKSMSVADHCQSVGIIKIVSTWKSLCFRSKLLNMEKLKYSMYYFSCIHMFLLHVYIYQRNFGGNVYIVLILLNLSKKEI